MRRRAEPHARGPRRPVPEPWDRRRLLAVLGAGVLAFACARPPSPALPADPPRWNIASGSGSMLLLGSVHLGSAGGWELPPDVDAAFDRSEALIVEVDVRGDSMKKHALSMLRRGRLPSGVSLSDRISPELSSRLDLQLERLGSSRSLFERLQPWMVALGVLALDLRERGLDPAQGVDRALLDRSASDSEVIALETADEQIALLADLSPELSALMLSDTLHSLESRSGGIDPMLRAWRSGDDAELESLIFDAVSDDDALAPFYEAVFFERNRRMAERLAALLEEERHLVAVVGAGHLLGERGIPALLRRMGYHPVRVRDERSAPADVEIEAEGSQRAGDP